MKSIYTALAELGEETAKKLRRNFLAGLARRRRDPGVAYFVHCEGGPFDGHDILARNFSTATFKVRDMIGHYEKVQKYTTRYAVEKGDVFIWVGN